MKRIKVTKTTYIIFAITLLIIISAISIIIFEVKKSRKDLTLPNNFTSFLNQSSRLSVNSNNQKNFKENKEAEEWKDFVEEKHQFSFKYPAIKKVERIDFPEEKRIILTIGENISIFVEKIDEKQSSQKDNLIPPSDFKIYSQEDVEISNLKGKRYNQGEFFIVAKDGYQYIFITMNNTSSEAREELEKIVTSFKFF